MCELLGVSSLQPVTLEMSLQTLMSHAEIRNPDGWGIVFYEKNDAYVFREPRPANTSKLTELVANSGLQSQLVVSHIRRATSGAVELQNTHPFTREVNGQLHSFAFNGNVPEIFNARLDTNGVMPMGATDAEHAFCILLQQIKSIDSDVMSVVQSFGDQLASLGPANFLYSDSRNLYAYASHRIGHKGKRISGLFVKNRNCNFDHIPNTNPTIGLKLGFQSRIEQQLVLIASVPLSDEDWVPFEENQLMVIHKGHIINR